MCGFITVISKTDAPFDQDKLVEMADMIAHRGPDDQGTFFHENWLAFAFKRLSILDLTESGHQPMVSADGDVAIVYNGEIYNYLELRAELEKDGVVFRSHTDTEVVLEAYRKWGERCVDRFVGMFAFAVADLKKRTVLAVRDPLGIKPLFHFENDKFHILCSEIKSLLPYVDLEPNQAAFDEYLVFRFVMGSETLFKNVRNLPPGHNMTYENGELRRREYFNISDQFQPDVLRSFPETCDMVEETLKESVKIHLRSDVELGVQLSGGVDSSLITAMAAGETGKRFHSFSISFDDEEMDESKYQKMVSERYGTVHHDYPMDEQSFTDHLMETIWHYEHPLNDPNTACTLYLTKKARKHVTVMLSGEGADESFLGYTRFKMDCLQAMMRRNWLHHHPLIRECLWRLSKKPMFNVTRYNPPMYTLTYADLNDVDKLLKGDDSSMAYRQETIKWADDNIIYEAMIQDQVCDLLQWFWRADRAGMAASMELRVPFCTEPMFQAANSIPYGQRVHLGERKAVLKKIAEKYLDHEQIYRKKIGFGVPIANWMDESGPYSDLFTDTMESAAFRGRGDVDHAHFDELLARQKNGALRERSPGFLWTYFNLELWRRIFFEGGWKRFS